MKSLRESADSYRNIKCERYGNQNIACFFGPGIRYFAEIEEHCATAANLILIDPA